MEPFTLIATISALIQNVGIITSAIASLWVVAPYVKVGMIYTYNGIKYVGVKAKDGTVKLAKYIHSQTRSERLKREKEKNESKI
jgi:hypothetical protein